MQVRGSTPRASFLFSSGI